MIFLSNVLSDNNPESTKIALEQTPFLDLLSNTVNEPEPWLYNYIPWISKVLADNDYCILKDHLNGPLNIVIRVLASVY